MAASSFPLLPSRWTRTQHILGVPWATDQPLLEVCLAVGLGERDLIRKRVRHRELSYLWYPVQGGSGKYRRSGYLSVDWAEQTYAALLEEPVISFRPITSYDLEIASGLRAGIVIFATRQQLIRAVLAGEPDVSI